MEVNCKYGAVDTVLRALMQGDMNRGFDADPVMVDVIAAAAKALAASGALPEEFVVRAVAQTQLGQKVRQFLADGITK
jgi:hypothetical protein